MNEIMNISGVDCYEQDGTAYLKLEAVARGLGFTREKNGTEYVMWDRVKKYLSEIGFHTSVENGVPTCGHNPKFPQVLSKTQSFLGTEKSLVYYRRHKWQRESA